MLTVQHFDTQRIEISLDDKALISTVSYPTERSFTVRSRIVFNNIRLLPMRFYKRCRSISCRGERGRMAGQYIELPQGTLDLLILRTLALGCQHGWAISERVQQISSDVLRIQQGSLYPALHRLERRGLIKAHWGTSENNRRAKYYELSKSGRQQLEVETDAWAKLTAAVAQVLGSV